MKNDLFQPVIQKALYENYESIYVVDAETSSYRCYHESDSYSRLNLEEEGDNFFETLETNILQTIDPEDQDFVREHMTREALHAGLKRRHYYSFVYRLILEGKPLYHKLRAIKEKVEGREYFLIGIRNVDQAFRQDQAQARELQVLQNREKTHLRAVLATASGYLEINLSQDQVLELSPSLGAGISGTYTEFEARYAQKMVVAERDRYRRISDRDYLIRCFERGEMRASVFYSAREMDGSEKPCRKVFFLYRDENTEDIMCFAVIYDLTEEQRKERERKELEDQLTMSRIRNSTSQMQPHFLYNALGSIQEVVLEDPEYASDLLGDFTIHLRSCIRAMASDSLISFEGELTNIQAYVNIEKMRLGEKLKVIYDCQATDFSILPLSIQPLVENAIRHGIYERGKEGGTLTLSTKRDGDSVVITVQDTGVGFDVQEFYRRGENGESTGLNNLIFRLEQVMHALVNIRSKKGEGTIVTVVIPKQGE